MPGKKFLIIRFMEYHPDGHINPCRLYDHFFSRGSYIFFQKGYSFVNERRH